MDTFAFLVHPVNLKHIATICPPARFFPGVLVKELLKIYPPFVVSKITKINFPRQKESFGYFLGMPLLPEQMVSLPEEVVLKKIIRAGKLAEKLKTGIFGLGGYTSVVGDKGLTVSKKLSIPVTTGSAMTAWSVCEAIDEVMLKNSLRPQDSKLAIIGATGAIGSLCAKKLSGIFAEVVITARHMDKLLRLKQDMENLKKASVIIEQDVHKAVSGAQVVVTTTSTPEALIDVNELDNGSIVCDVSIPKNVIGRGEASKGITLVEGGLIQLPFDVDFGVDTGLPKNVIFACTAEIMLLTLEKRFENFSIGDNIEVSKVDEIGKIARKYGFCVFRDGSEADAKLSPNRDTLALS